MQELTQKQIEDAAQEASAAYIRNGTWIEAVKAAAPYLQYDPTTKLLTDVLKLVEQYRACIFRCDHSACVEYDDEFGQPDTRCTTCKRADAILSRRAAEPQPAEASPSPTDNELANMTCTAESQPAAVAETSPAPITESDISTGHACGFEAAHLYHENRLKGCTVIDNEVLADLYKNLSGNTQHASDCATSLSPAETPGPCDCDALFLNPAPADPEFSYTWDQIEKAVGSAWTSSVSSSAVHSFLNDVRARLNTVEKTPEARVLVMRVSYGTFGWRVFVDQEKRGTFNTEDDATIFRLGIIESLKKEGK